jgi:hypothetical protein
LDKQQFINAYQTLQQGDTEVFKPGLACRVLSTKEVVQRALTESSTRD